MKTLLTLITFSALVAPAAFAVPPGSSPSAAQLCREQRAAMSASDFASLYAPGKPKSAFGKCVSRQTLLLASDTANASKQCKAERGTTEESIAAFAKRYGQGQSNRNAHGKCVSSKVSGTAEARQEETLSAAKTCKTMRATNRAAYDAAYGTRKNAFGKCVSQTSKAQGADD